MSIFNTREIAIGIWVTLFFVWALTQPSIRESLSKVLFILTKKVILIPLALMAGYIGFMVWGLNKLGLWEVSQLKNTILWSGSVAFVSLIRLNDIANNPDYFKTTLKDNLRLITILEFVVGFYTFPLWSELLLVPFSVVLGSMCAL